MEQTLGKRIAQHRKRLNLTQDALAEQLGITAQAVSKWENDQSCPDINMLPRLSEIFGITTDELLGKEPPRQVHQAEVVEDAETSGLHVQKGNWEFHLNSEKKSAVVFALFVLWVGGLYLLAKWFDWDVSFWGIVWPSALLIYGLAEIFPRFSIFHVGLALFGGYYLAHNLGIWQIAIAGDLLFPICVVLFGLSLLVDALRKPKKPKFSITHKGGENEKTKYEGHTSSQGRFSCDLAFGAQTFCVDAPTLAGGAADCCFGELTVDLQLCQAVAPDCHVAANCAFGKLQLLVPRCFEVHCARDTAFGAVHFSGTPDPDPTGVIELAADVSFGEIIVQYI